LSQLKFKQPLTSDYGKPPALKFVEKTLRDLNVNDELLPIVITHDGAKQEEEIGFDYKKFGEHLRTWGIGRLLLYGKTVTSTQTLLMDHFLTFKDFTGLVFIADTQVSGRGRGNNVWVSPYGCLMFSLQLAPHAFEKVLYMQYLMALSIVEGFLSAPGCNAIELKIKWPNDIYYNGRKIGGILVTSNSGLDNSSLSHPIIGVGINFWNVKPTTCINEIIKQHNADHGTNIPYLSKEQFLALILNRYEANEATFLREGFHSLESSYYKHWLHSEQVVKLEADNAEVVIKGISKNGYLKAVGVGNSAEYELHPDLNSFDMMKGLILAKK